MPFEPFVSSSQTHSVFQGGRLVVTGSLATAAVAVAQAMRLGDSRPVLCFSDADGSVVDIDTRGTDSDVAARHESGPPLGPPSEPSALASVVRGRGRPRLGVVAREVTLLPRHWEWLGAQPGGASAAVRRLVDAARKDDIGKGDERAQRERGYRFISAIAGNEPGFEEACRALFAGDRHRFEASAARWPADVREHALRLAFTPAIASTE